LNPNDPAHAGAVSYAQTDDLPIVTSFWILTEVADGLSRSLKGRKVFLDLVQGLRDNPCCTILPLSEVEYGKALALYASREDKQWSLTDCLSFVAMKEKGIESALTGDRHFEQAGFTCLLSAR